MIELIRPRTRGGAGADSLLHRSINLHRVAPPADRVGPQVEIPEEEIEPWHDYNRPGPKVLARPHGSFPSTNLDAKWSRDI